MRVYTQLFDSSIRSLFEGHSSLFKEFGRTGSLSTAFTAGRSSAALEAARAGQPCDWLGSVDGADGCGLSGR